jgi:hypothetical protein
MAKPVKIRRDAATGKFLAGPLGRSKASKFSLVEGVTLSDDAARIMRQHQASGKNGSALRSAITGSFRNKSG